MKSKSVSRFGALAIASVSYAFLGLFFLVSCNMGGGSQESASDELEKNCDVEDNATMLCSSLPPEAKDSGEESKTWARSYKAANTTTLFVGDNEQLPLKGSQIAVKIDGCRARVLIDCFFYCDQEWQMEGTFKMKLPQGASPYYFAFGECVYLDKSNQQDSLPFIEYKEIDLSADKIEEIRSGKWTEPKVAKVVQKEKASFAYGQTVRRKVDPALAEWAGADVFNCRVFPLTPNKLHRIVFGYDVNLTNLQDDWIFNFPVPEVNCPLIIDFEVAEITGINCTVKPQQKIKSENGKKTFRAINPKEKEIVVRYKALQNIALQSPKEKTGDTYFSAFISPALPSSSNSQVSDRAIIALDISLSSNPDKFNVWLKLTKALLLNNQNILKRFNVLLFNVETFWWKNEPVENNPGNVEEFLNFANQISLEGASDIGLAFSEISNAGWAKSGSDNIFLLSDGADTWGEDDEFEISKNINQNDIVFAFNTGMSGTNISKLNQLTRTSGGALFSIAGEDEVQKVSAGFLSKPWKIENIVISGVADILVAGAPVYLYPGQKMLITGRGTVDKNATVTVKVSQDNAVRDVTIQLDKSIESDLTERIYGQIATGRLEEFADIAEKHAVAYAKHFNVPGKTCSLLMLDTEEDYKQYNITATEDAYVVQSSPVNQIIEAVLQDIEKMLGNAKIKFKNWLNKLTNTDGVEFNIPASLDIIIDKIPEAAFTINHSGLKCKLRFKNEVPAPIADSLANPLLDYDLVNTEANRRLEKYGPPDALKILSSLVERDPGNSVMARDVAYSALDWNLNEQAYFLFKRVLKTRPYEPQTYMAIAKSLAKTGNNELSLIYYEIAITAKWDERFGEFRRIAALDYLNFLSQIKDQNKFVLSDYASSRFKTLRSEFEEEYADLMITIYWNTDNTDVDLHVIEPTGEECYYQHRKTRIGGLLSTDVTQGYGPEMYILQDAKSGKYQVKVKYFSDDRNRASTRTKIYATINTNWGKKNEKIINKVVTLEDNKEMHDIITVEIP